MFGTEAFTELPDGVWSISDVLAIAEENEADALPDAVETEGEAEEAAPVPDFVERYVILVAQRTPERVRPLEEVRAQVTSAVLAQARAELRNAWLAELRARIEVDESLGAAADAPFVFGDEPAPEATEEAADGRGRRWAAAADGADAETTEPETDGEPAAD